MAKKNIMTVGSLKKLLNTIENKFGDSYKIGLSSDEEGNQYLPMFEDTELSIAVDKQAKRIIFFPSHS